jgi:hypothetical protein
LQNQHNRKKQMQHSASLLQQQQQQQDHYSGTTSGGETEEEMMSAASSTSSSSSSMVDEMAIVDDCICIICQCGSFSKAEDALDTKITPKCGHSFHARCLTEWVERSAASRGGGSSTTGKTCPMCRSAIDDETLKRVFSKDLVALRAARLASMDTYSRAHRMRGWVPEYKCRFGLALPPQIDYHAQVAAAKELGVYSRRIQLFLDTDACLHCRFKLERMTSRIASSSSCSEAAPAPAAAAVVEEEEKEEGVVVWDPSRVFEHMESQFFCDSCTHRLDVVHQSWNS